MISDYLVKIKNKRKNIQIFIKSLTSTLSGLVIASVCLFMKIGHQKWNFFGDKNFFSWISVSKMGVKMNIRIITKNNAANPEIGFFTKLILKPYDRAAAMPTAWELMTRRFNSFLFIKILTNRRIWVILQESLRGQLLALDLSSRSLSIQARAPTHQ